MTAEAEAREQVKRCRAGRAGTGPQVFHPSWEKFAGLLVVFVHIIGKYILVGSHDVCF